MKMRLGDCRHKEHTLCIVPWYHRLETIRHGIGLVWIGELKRGEGGEVGPHCHKQSAVYTSPCLNV